MRYIAEVYCDGGFNDVILPIYYVSMRVYTYFQIHNISLLLFSLYLHVTRWR